MLAQFTTGLPSVIVLEYAECIAKACTLSDCMTNVEYIVCIAKACTLSDSMTNVE